MTKLQAREAQVFEARLRSKAALLLLLSLLPWAAAAQSRSMTATEVMQRVIAATGASPPADTVDTLKAGDPNTVVTGIVTTFMATHAVLQKAVAAHKNLIITHEPTFYNHQDDQSLLADDPVQQQKLKYIHEHHLVVWRFHDTWHKREPDGILAGMVDQFGWKSYPSNLNPHLFTVPKTTVAKLARSLKHRTGANAIRIVGDPAMLITKVALLPGAAGSDRQIKLLQDEKASSWSWESRESGKRCPMCRTLQPRGVTKHLSCSAMRYQKKRG